MPRYSARTAANGYSIATGVGAGFSLAAVVLVFTLIGGATEPGRVSHYDLSFAAAMFTVGTIGLLICSFSYATLSSVSHDDPATLYHLMANSAALTLCFLSELAGFDALGAVYLAALRVMFVAIICASVILSPFWIWAIQNDFGDAYGDLQAKTDACWASLLAGLVGVAMVGVLIALRDSGDLEAPHRALYQLLAFLLLAVVGGLSCRGAWISSRTDGRHVAKKAELFLIAGLFLGAAGLLITLLP